MPAIEATFVCLPDETVVTGGRSRKLRRLANAANPPELLAVTVSAETSPGRSELRINNCQVSRVIPAGRGDVLVRRCSNDKVVLFPLARPKLGLEVYRRLLGTIARAFGQEATMRAYYSVLWPKLQSWVEDDVLGAAHLGPCLETRDPKGIRAAVERHRGNQVIVTADICTDNVQAPVGEHLMFLQEVRHERTRKGLALVLVSSTVCLSGSEELAAMSKVVLPYHPGKIAAHVYPDGVTVYSLAAGLMLDLVELRAGSPGTALPSLFS